ncbi:MAG: hypothetical protein DMG13_03865 [Acidobacteria bacterium]|nr:MAG: hypothetical protein DMG13_03865 [Acidobacteriota bacterium]
MSHIGFSRLCECSPGHAVDYCVNGHQVRISRFRTELAKVDTTPAFVHGWTLPGNSPLTGRALIEQDATMYRACNDKPEIPYGPPDRVLPKAGRAQARASVIQIIGANGFATE